LALTLRDTKSVISKLERLLGAIIHTLFIFFYLAIFKVGPGSRLSICRLLQSTQRQRRQPPTAETPCACLPGPSPAAD
jgi:hypothetical protein